MLRAYRQGEKSVPYVLNQASMTLSVIVSQIPPVRRMKQFIDLLPKNATALTSLPQQGP